MTIAAIFPGGDATRSNPKLMRIDRSLMTGASRARRALAVFLAMGAVIGVVRAQTASTTLTPDRLFYASTGGKITLTVDISYLEQPTALGGSIAVPGPGWTVASTGGRNIPEVRPATGSDRFEYAYVSPPAGGAQFTVELNYPAGGGDRIITASFQYRTPTQTITPAPVLLRQELVAVRFSQIPILMAGAPAAAFNPVVAVGGGSPYNLTISPALPSGLVFDPLTGEITGTPAVALPATNYTVTITDAYGARASESFSLSVNPPLAPLLATPRVTSQTLAVGAPAAFSAVNVSGGIPPYFFSISPALPTGLVCDPATGRITGTPAAASPVTTYAVTVSDSLGAQAVQSFSLGVNLAPPLTVAQAVPSQVLAIGVPVMDFNPVTASGGVAPYAFSVLPPLPAGLAMDVSTGRITGTPTAAHASTTYAVVVMDSVGARTTQSFGLSIRSAVEIVAQPRNANTAVGGSVTLDVTATGISTPTYQWRKDGTAIAGATNAWLTLPTFQVTDVGSYSVDVSSGGRTVRSQAAVVGLSSPTKVAGAGYEFQGDIIHGGTGYTYDQVLLTGPAATITADPGQITRISYVDLSDDIVQVEFSGAGSLTLTLENPSGPALPLKYNQDVNYMKGHASLTITGADETTNVSVFSVGTATAFNQALFPEGVSYDGVADIGLISISSTNGKFGGIRTANAGYFRTAGQTGIYAPGVAIQGPVFVGDITADADATAVMIFGGTGDVRITGGDLQQLNGRAVQVDGISTLTFSPGTKSNGTTQASQANRAQLEDNGVNVTAEIVR